MYLMLPKQILIEKIKFGYLMTGNLQKFTDLNEKKKKKKSTPHTNGATNYNRDTIIIPFNW